MSRRTIIISDTHLGRRRHAARSAAALRPLWRDADHLIINGDVAEVHHHRHWSQAARETLRLLDLCESDGVTLTLLAGNHDPGLTDARHLLLADDQILVTHGDVLHPAVAPWSPHAKVIRAAHDEALRHLAPQQRPDLQARLTASTYAAHAEWRELERQAGRSSIPRMLLRPHALLQVLHYWRTMPRLAAAFLREHAPAARFIILGHTHRPGIWSIDDRIIINTGSFGFPGRPWAVTLQDRELSVVPILQNRGRYELVDKSLRQFRLPARDAIYAKPSRISHASLANAG